MMIKDAVEKREPVEAEDVKARAEILHAFTYPEGCGCRDCNERLIVLEEEKATTEKKEAMAVWMKEQLFGTEAN